LNLFAPFLIVRISIVCDDILTLSYNEEVRAWDKKMMSQRFDMDERGQVEWYLGMHVVRNGDSLTFSQSLYIATLLDRF
jgi:hypothetical protein